MTEAPPGVAGPDVRLLRLFLWARLGVAELLLVVAPFLPAGTISSTASLVAALLLAVVSSGILLLHQPTRHAEHWAWLLSILDVVLVTAIVAATGGPRSIYGFTYVLSVTAASVLLSRPRAVAIAGLASLLYTGLVVGRTVVPVAFLLEPIEEATALELMTMFLNAATFLAVAIVAGGLAERYRATRQALESQHRDLQELHAFKDVVMRSVGTGLVAVDRMHIVTALNRAAEELVGRPAADVLGRPWSEVFGSTIALKPIQDAIAENPRGTSRYETTLDRPDGSRRAVRLTFSALRSGEGRWLGLMAACEDISEIRDMERRVRQADRLATLGRMAANIAHEIRNPLASLTGAIEVLSGDLVSAQDRARLREIVTGESARLNQIIENFLAYARPLPVVTASVNVAELIEEVLLLLEHRDLPPGLKVVREFPPDLCWQLDGAPVRQAIWNLCLNSLQAMPAGGELRVAAWADSEVLTIAVSDTGEGIDAADLPHVLEPFYSTRPGGSGLGLALVHRTVQEHGGDVDIRSSPGHGTTVLLRLPAAGVTTARTGRG